MSQTNRKNRKTENKINLLNFKTPHVNEHASSNLQKAQIIFEMCYFFPAEPGIFVEEGDTSETAGMHLSGIKWARINIKKLHVVSSSVIE